MIRHRNVLRGMLAAGLFLALVLGAGFGRWTSASAQGTVPTVPTRTPGSGGGGTGGEAPTSTPPQYLPTPTDTPAEAATAAPGETQAPPTESTGMATATSGAGLQAGSAAESATPTSTPTAAAPSQGISWIIYLLGLLVLLLLIGVGWYAYTIWKRDHGQGA